MVIRYFVLSAVLLASCSTSTPITPSPVAGQQPLPPGAADSKLRVMTYNIKHGQTNATCTQPPAVSGQPPFPDCNLDLNATIAVIRAHAPDIVALQEVDRFWARSGYVDEPEAIAGALQMPHHCFAPNLDHPADGHANRPHQYGTAIVSRFPIVTCANTLVTTTPGWEQRGILGALIDMRGTSMRAYSTHLQASRTVGGVSESAAPQRVLQVQDILNLVSTSSEPIVLMGDFNAGSTSTEMKPLFTSLRDVWSEAGSGSGNTSPGRLTGNPTSRIDYIFISKRVSISSVYVPIDAQTNLASDHYPVVADIALTGM